MTRSQPNTATSTPLLITALATVFCSSAGIMMLQLVAGRLAAAYLGQSLYTWTSAIGVTLAGIAIGNAIGGRIADRAPGTRSLGLLLLVAAACVLSVLALNPIAGSLKPLIVLPWPARIFLHMALVFLLPFTALGTISPGIAKLALGAGGPSGQRIGSVFAWSIAGSLIGVFVTGFFLLGWLGSHAILICSALVLATIGATLLTRGNAGSAARLESDAETGPASKTPLRHLLIIFFAGALVMMVELAAARMLSRVYGNSLFTWTSTIGTILAAMALGGRFGGRWADRFGAQATMTALLIAAAASCATVPLLHNVFYLVPILWDLPWPVQILVHTILVFFVPCFLLGAVPPAVVRHAVDGNPAAGQAVGKLYAWNSVGSIVGAFLTGYVLIAALGSVQVVCVVFLLAAGLALVSSPSGTAPYVACGVAVFLGLAAFAPVPPFNDIGKNLRLRPYRAPNTVFEKESQYSYVAVNVIDPETAPSVRNFVLDKLVHSKADIDHPLELKYPYMVFFAAAADALHPAVAPLKTLTVGGGGYSFITYLEATRPGGHTEVVEIDPVVTEAAHEAFGFPWDTKAQVIHMDGRNYVEQEAKTLDNGDESDKYDMIFGDCVSDYNVPFHLTTREYTEYIARLLKEDGVYLLNMIDMYEIGEFLGAVVGTMNSVFNEVQVFCPAGKLDGRETFIVVGAKRPVDLAKAAEVVNAKTGLPGRFLTKAELDALRARVRIAILTDDFAPVENLLAPVVLRTEQSNLIRRLARADDFLGEGRPEKAIREMEKVLARTKSLPEAFELAAKAYAANGNAARAVAVLAELVKTFPGNAEYLDRYAVALLRAGRPQEAVQNWVEALQLTPDNAQIHLNLGAALVQLKRFDEAEPHLRTAAAAMPDSLQAQSALANLSFGRGDFPGAVALLRAAIEHHPDAPELQQQLAIAAFTAKDYDTAWQAVGAARRLGAEMPPALLRDLQRDSGRTQ